MIGRVAYRSGFVKRLDGIESLPVCSIDGSDLPKDVIEIVEPLLDLGGTYGDPQAGDPIQDDEPRIASMTKATWRSSSTTAPSCCSRPTARVSGGFTRCAAGSNA